MPVSEGHVETGVLRGEFSGIDDVLRPVEVIAAGGARPDLSGHTSCRCGLRCWGLRGERSSRDDGEQCYCCSGYGTKFSITNVVQGPSKCFEIVELYQCAEIPGRLRYSG